MVSDIIPESSAPTVRHTPVPRSAREALEVVLERDRHPELPRATPVATGFDLLDRVLDGGLRPHDLILVGGSPGVGKTVAALQMARNIARAGNTAIYLSYEHDEPTMLGRLLCLELGDVAGVGRAAEADRLCRVVMDAATGFRSLEDVLGSEPLAAEAHDRLTAYADRVLLVRGNGAHTDVAAVEQLVGDVEVVGDLVVVVDYLQKVALHPEPEHEAEKVTRVVEGLKDLALRHRLIVLALVAADWDGLRSGRVRLHHLRGSSALAYECDIALMLNEKHAAVARAHLAYDTVKAESYKHLVVFSVEKNRGGPAMVDVEFRKDFLHYRFEPRGAYMAERAADDRLQAS